MGLIAEGLGFKSCRTAKGGLVPSSVSLAQKTLHSSASKTHFEALALVRTIVHGRENVT